MNQKKRNCPWESTCTRSYGKKKSKKATLGFQNRSLGLHSDFIALRDVAVGHFANEVGVRVEEHDVKVLDGMDGLESGPILEPHDLLGSAHHQHTHAHTQI